jgi:predicted DCC family thiol-disulfide oxidoreductase YuxK
MQLARSLCDKAGAILESKEALLEKLVQLFMNEWIHSAKPIPFKLPWERFAFLFAARNVDT